MLAAFDPELVGLKVRKRRERYPTRTRADGELVEGRRREETRGVRASVAHRKAVVSGGADAHGTEGEGGRRPGEYGGGRDGDRIGAARPCNNGKLLEVRLASRLRGR
jgi:hypothetical protein